MVREDTIHRGWGKTKTERRKRAEVIWREHNSTVVSLFIFSFLLLFPFVCILFFFNSLIQVLYLDKTADQAWEPLSQMSQCRRGGKDEENHEDDITQRSSTMSGRRLLDGWMDGCSLAHSQMPSLVFFLWQSTVSCFPFLFGWLVAPFSLHLFFHSVHWLCFHPLLPSVSSCSCLLLSVFACSFFLVQSLLLFSFVMPPCKSAHSDWRSGRKGRRGGRDQEMTEEANEETTGWLTDWLTDSLPARMNERLSISFSCHTGWMIGWVYEEESPFGFLPIPCFHSSSSCCCCCCYYYCCCCCRCCCCCCCSVGLWLFMCPSARSRLPVSGLRNLRCGWVRQEEIEKKRRRGRERTRSSWKMNDLEWRNNKKETKRRTKKSRFFLCGLWLPCPNRFVLLSVFLPASILSFLPSFPLSSSSFSRYEYYERIENGDFHFVVPNRFIAFSGPARARMDVDGFRLLTPRMLDE